MIFNASITTPADRAADNPLHTKLRVCKGLVFLIEVDIPAGVCGLAHIQIYDGAYQLLPASPRESLTGDGVILSYDDLYLKENAPYELLVKTWNLDETWPHTFQVRVGVASSRAFMGRYMPSIAWEDQQDALREIQAQQITFQQEQARILLKQMRGE